MRGIRKLKALIKYCKKHRTCSMCELYAVCRENHLYPEAWAIPEGKKGKEEENVRREETES